jgi:hypothetical protein
MLEYERVRRVVLGTEDPTERKLRFLALLTSSLPKGGEKPVLTGGSAIEIYLDGMLRTGDMGIVYNVAELRKILKELHFKLGSALRSYYNEELLLAVDLVGEKLNGSNDKVTTITTKYGPVTVIGIEDLILKRLASAKFWNNPTDMEQVYLLARSQQDTVDWDYLETEAKKEDIIDYLRKLKDLLEQKNTRKSLR